MGLEQMWMLLASVVALALGPLVYGAAGARPRLMAVLDGAVVLSVGVMVVAQILPEAFAVAGWMASIPLVIGLLGPTLVERGIERLASPTHGAVLLLVALGLGAHALADGIALSTGGDAPWHALPAAVVLHRIPTSLVVWRLVGAEGHWHRAVIALGLIAAGTVAGYAAGAGWEDPVHSPALGFFQAFIAGSLLHVVVHAWHPRHVHGPRASDTATAAHQHGAEDHDHA